MSTSDTLSEVTKHRMFFVCSLRRYLVLYPAKEGSDERRDTSSGTAHLCECRHFVQMQKHTCGKPDRNGIGAGARYRLARLAALTQSMTVESFEVHRVAR